MCINDIDIDLLIMTITTLILTITYITCTFQPRNMRTKRHDQIYYYIIYHLSLIFPSNENEKYPLTVARVDWRSVM